MQLQYEKPVTVEDMVAEANKIWNFVYDKRINGRLVDTKDEQAVMKEVLEKWRPFMTHYSLIVRYMVSFGLYHPKALTAWLQYLQKNPWKNEDEQFRRLAKYVRILHNCCTPSAKYGDVFEDEIYRSLRDEREEFKRMTQQVQQNHKEETINRIKERIMNADEETRNQLISKYCINQDVLKAIREYDEDDSGDIRRMINRGLSRMDNERKRAIIAENNPSKKWELIVSTCPDRTDDEVMKYMEEAGRTENDNETLRGHAKHFKNKEKHIEYMVKFGNYYGISSYRITDEEIESVLSPKLEGISSTEQRKKIIMENVYNSERREYVIAKYC